MLKGTIITYQSQLRQLNKMLIINDDMLFNISEGKQYGYSNKELEASLQQIHDKIIETIISISYQFSKINLELDNTED